MPPGLQSAFTLLELLISVSILAILLLVTSAIINQTSQVWRSTSALTSAFRDSRAAFESITRRLSQATLHPYFDFVDTSGQTRAVVGSSFVPEKFERQSELHFVCGQAAALLNRPMGGHAVFFQAPLGFTEEAPTGDAQLVNLLNAIGYYVEYGDDSRWRPSFLDTLNVPLKKRYRLMQMVQGSESLQIYKQALTAANRFDWFRVSLANNPALARPLAENVILLVLTPLEPGGAEDSLTSDYVYDSKSYLQASTAPKTFQNQLPPAVRVTIISLDEVSAGRLELKYPNGSAPYLQPDDYFTDITNYETDLAAITSALNTDRLTYRVFSTNVVIRQSKFSAREL